MRAFTPPFRFTQFFSPEDTLLCMCAAESAANKASRGRLLKIAELTTGSGLVGLDILSRWESSELLGMDVDPVAIETASRNAAAMSVSARCRFVMADLWSEKTPNALREYNPDVVICNPPYVPEPAGARIQIEAGAGSDGTAHLMRTADLLGACMPAAAALSWCSLANPAKVVDAVSNAGYELRELFIVAIADGEYSGSVYDYLKTLPSCYISESSETLARISSDGSAAFAYLLLSGVFVRGANPACSSEVEFICSEFAREGLEALAKINMDIPVKCWVLDRWDELQLRVMLH
jgi:hypothetical protein